VNLLGGFEFDPMRIRLLRRRLNCAILISESNSF